ncbi:MAG TPA: Ig domain-containing protein, partial [Vicinamibacteria bacterium]|nr:Ig domain-containing protein [Vicinamibacteria bacterium]
GTPQGPKNVTVTNPDGQARTGAGILNVACPALDLQPPAVPGAILGAPYSQTFTLNGGLAPATFSLTGGLPAGLTFNAGAATLSGTPTQGGSFPFTVGATDAGGCSTSRAYTLVVSCPPLSVNPLTLSTGRQGTPYAQAFSASGQTSAVTFGLTGTLPAGLTFNPATATLSGTPTQSGAFVITVGVTDTFACTAARTYNLVIAGPAAVVPAALAVDANGNGVLEANQTAGVDPSWTNQTGAPVTLTGTLSSLIGPAGATYAIVDGGASYGTVADGATARCSTATGDCYSVSITAGGRPAVHWDASVVESLSTGGPKAWALHVGGSFADVPGASVYYRFIEILLHRGISTGCGGNLYCPGNATGRDAMAVFVLVGKEGSGYLPPACTTPLFADVPASSPFCRWIEELARRGVVGGCGGGNYCPSSPVTREQMAVFISATFALTLYGV